MNGSVERLPILILNPHSRCNCRCIMCDIWKSTETRAMSDADLEQHVDSIDALGVGWVVLSGGEPLMHKGLFRFCASLRARGIRITILSTGLLLARDAPQIVRWIDEVIVSLDGPTAIHDRIRRVPGAFEQLSRGVAAIRASQPDYKITARCTVQSMNCGSLVEVVETARTLQLDGISFLAADLTSEAFNRPGGWQPSRQSGVALSVEDFPILAQQIEHLIDRERGRGFVAETPEKLRRILRHFEAHLEGSEPTAPRCNAPWVSAVVEADGTVRPCFFQPPIGRVSDEQSLLSIIQSKEAATFRDGLHVASNPICRRCVCSLNWNGTAERD